MISVSDQDISGISPLVNDTRTGVLDITAKNETKKVVLSGPTSFAPIIRKSMDLVRKSRNKFHILVIIADGQMADEGPTLSAIVDASKLPLSIVLVGVGDGPWDFMGVFECSEEMFIYSFNLYFCF